MDEAGAVGGFDDEPATVLLETLAHAAQAVAFGEAAGALAIVARFDGDFAVGFGDGEPEVTSVGVAHGVGDDLLDATEEGVGAEGVGHVEGLLHFEMDGGMEDGGGELADGGAEIDGGIVAHGADDFAHFGEEGAGDEVGADDLFGAGPFDDAAGELEVNAEGGEEVAGGIVEVAGDAEAFAHAGGFGEERLGGEDFAVAESEFAAGLFGALEDDGGEVGKGLPDGEHEDGDDGLDGPGQGFVAGGGMEFAAAVGDPSEEGDPGHLAKEPADSGGMTKDEG